MIKTAVIGVGTMGRNHARVYNELREAELVAVADIDSIRAKEIAHRYKIKAYTDYREMLRQERLDAVSIAVPTRLHYQVALDVIEGGLHLLVEKPIASTVEEAKNIIRLANERELKLAVGHVERYNPVIIELRRWLEEDKLGRLFQIHTQRLGSFPAAIRNEGVAIDLATHDLDIMHYLTGKRIQRLYAEIKQGIHVSNEDLLSGLIRFEDGVLGEIGVSWLSPIKVRKVTVTGQRGMLLADLLTQDLYYYENKEANDIGWNYLDWSHGRGIEGSMIQLRIHRQEPLRIELETFVAAAQGEKATIVSGTDGLTALALALMLVRSGREGRVIEQSEIDLMYDGCNQGLIGYKQQGVDKKGKASGLN